MGLFFIYTTSGRDVKRGVGVFEVFESTLKSENHVKDCDGICLRVEV